MHPLYACICALLALLHSPQPKAHTAPQRASRGVERTHAVRAPSGPCGGWRHLVERYEWNVDTACRVLVCESKGDPSARNRSGATGLFQILRGGSTDPDRNVAQAVAMWRARGWQPWVCR